MAIALHAAVQLVQLALVLALAPLLTGFVRRLKAHLLRRQGPPLLQPYRDLLRLLRKEVVLAHSASWLFRVTPYLVFATTWVAAALVPTFAVGLVFSNAADMIAIVALLGSARFLLALAGLDVGTSFGGIGSSREMMIASLAAPAIRDLVSSGEIDAAPSVFQTHALEAAEKGAPVGWEPLDIVPTHSGAAVVMAKAPHPYGALLFADFLLGPDGQAVFERFKYGSATKEYGFKRWYTENGFTVEQYEREVGKWEKVMHSIVVRKGG